MPIPFGFLQDVHRELASRDWAGLPTLRVTDEALVKSALAAPFQSAVGEDVYPTVPAKAACLFRGLVKNHGLADGNKRLAVTTLTVFLVLNGRVPTYSNTELYKYALRVARAKGAYRVDHIEGWVRRHSRLAAPPQRARARAVCADWLRRHGPADRLLA